MPTVCSLDLNPVSNATEDALGALHGRVARVMDNALRQHEHAQDLYEATPTEQLQETGAVPPEVNPALLSVITRFLDSNKITCAPADSAVMTSMEKRLEDKRVRREGRRTVGNVTHLDLTGTD